MNVALTLVAFAAVWMGTGVVLASALGPRLRRFGDDRSRRGYAVDRRAIEPLRWILPASIVAVALASSTGLAAAGVLPSRVQVVAQSVLGRVGLEVPDPQPRPLGEGPASRGEVASPSPAASAASGRAGGALPGPSGPRTPPGADRLGPSEPATPDAVPGEAPPTGPPAGATEASPSTTTSTGAPASPEPSRVRAPGAGVPTSSNSTSSTSTSSTPSSSTSTSSTSTSTTSTTSTPTTVVDPQVRPTPRTTVPRPRGHQDPDRGPGAPAPAPPSDVPGHAVVPPQRPVDVPPVPVLTPPAPPTDGEAVRPGPGTRHSHRDAAIERRQNRAESRSTERVGPGAVAEPAPPLAAPVPDESLADAGVAPSS